MSQPTEIDSVPPELPRLRILHLLLWMVAVSVVMTAYSGLFQDSQDWTILSGIEFLTTTIPQTIALATLALGVFWRIKGANFFDEVGHYLLIVASANLIGTITSQMVVTSFSFEEKSFTNSWAYIFLIGAAIWPFAVGVVLLLNGKKAADTESWRLFCKVVGIMYLMSPLLFIIPFVYVLYGSAGDGSLIGIFVMLVSLGIQILWGLLCVVAVREDLASHWQRHWTHWCGVIVWLVVTVSNFVLSIYGNLAKFLIS